MVLSVTWDSCLAGNAKDRRAGVLFHWRPGRRDESAGICWDSFRPEKLTIHEYTHCDLPGGGGAEQYVHMSSGHLNGICNHPEDLNI
jgi:hypothetical protein